jgi:hypothetical protein
MWWENGEREIGDENMAWGWWVGGKRTRKDGHIFFLVMVFFL